MNIQIINNGYLLNDSNGTTYYETLEEIIEPIQTEKTRMINNQRFPK